MVEPINVLILAISGLCPLSFLIGAAAILILVRQSGYFQETEVVTLNEIDRGILDTAVGPLVRAGWDIAGMHRSETVGKMTVILKRKRQRFL